MTDLDGDSIYTVTVDSIAEGDITYKFHDGDDWESTPDRMWTVVAGPQTIPVAYFNDDSVCSTSSSVTFQVDMSVRICEGFMQIGDAVNVPGSFNGWVVGATPMEDLDGDSIYTATVDIPEGPIEYKFHDGDDWESTDNRMYTVVPGPQTIPVVYFNDDDVCDAFSVNMLFQTDMNAYIQLGWFRSDLGDQMQVRGSFQSWAAGTYMDDPLFTGVYEYLATFTTSPGDIFYKFYMDLDSNTAPARFPGWTPCPCGPGTADGYNYEHPAEAGDGNRSFSVGGGGTYTPDVYWYSDINNAGILNAGNSVDVTFTVDMTPATPDFNAETDTVVLRWQDVLWQSAQVLIQGAFPREWEMTRMGTTNTYTVTIPIEGATHYNMQYTYRYGHPDGTGLSEGGGLGGSNPFRSRFIMPNGPNDFPTSYSTPAESWQQTPPMPGENAPFNTLNSVEPEPQLGVPTVYRLTQNYPNPFNPATRIKYSIPERAHVTLKIYNVLGEEVASLVNQVQDQGNYVASFEANGLASGVYFYRLDAGEFSQTMKMVLMK
jgi:hypothetical protein